MYQLAISLALALSSLLLVQGQDQNCLNCICQASTNCNNGIGCHGGGSSKLCGPFLISWGYWFDGGQKRGNFEQCANDRGCSEESVRGYVRRYGRDCDGNGGVDCLDYARIHKMGNAGCSDNGVTGTAYWNAFQQCYGGGGVGGGGGGGGGGGNGFDDDDYEP